mmetsp:Transcript_25932/g.65791  ORF Transcript_25932/g.65791 Transcript_25932/m.65791 type:complete len:151 (-) Transcript_25932:88-540(-)
MRAKTYNSSAGLPGNASNQDVPLRIRTGTRATQKSELQGGDPLQDEGVAVKVVKTKKWPVVYKSRKVKFGETLHRSRHARSYSGSRSTDPVATTKGNQPTTRLVGATSFVVSPSSASVSAAALRKNSSRAAMAILARRTMTKPDATATIQ